MEWVGAGTGGAGAAGAVKLRDDSISSRRVFKSSNICVVRSSELGLRSLLGICSDESAASVSEATTRCKYSVRCLIIFTR